jgi:IS30 family transposase
MGSAGLAEECRGRADGQYLSRGADLRQLDQAALDAIATELNGRPRQTLGFKTPSQVLAEALR